MGFAIGATMTYGEVGSDSRYMINAVEVVHTIAIGNISLTTQQIHDRCVGEDQHS